MSNFLRQCFRRLPTNQRFILNAFASPVHRVDKSSENVKFIRWDFLDFSSPFDPFSRFLLLRKLEEFGCPKHMLVWLSDYFTRKARCTRLKRKMYALLVNNSGVLQLGIVYPYLFSKQISLLPLVFPSHLLKNADNATPIRSISETENVFDSSKNLLLIHVFSDRFGLKFEFVKIHREPVHFPSVSLPVWPISLKQSHSLG